MTSQSTELGLDFQQWDEGEGILPEELFSLIFGDPEINGSQQTIKDIEAPQLLSDFAFPASEAANFPQPAGTRGSSGSATRQRKQGVRVSKAGPRNNMRIMEEQAAKQAALANEIETINHKLRLRTKAMEYAVEVRSQLLSILEASREPQPNAAIQWAKSTSVSTLAAAFRSFVEEASFILLDLDTDAPNSGDQGLERLTDMVFEFTRRAFTVFVLKPETQYYMMTHRADRESPGEHDGPAPGHWEPVAAGLKLTTQQQEEFTACWDLTQDILAKNQRDITSARLELARELECSEGTASPSLDTAQKRLMAALANQNMTMKAMSLVVIGKILTPVQVARTLVLSFPFMPNGQEVIRCLSTQMQREHLPGSCGQNERQHS